MSMMMSVLALAVGVQDQEKKRDEGLRSESLQRVRKALDEWSARSWDQVLAEDVVLAVRRAEMVQGEDGTSALVSVRTEVRGKDKVTQALKKLHEDYQRRVTISSELLSGRQAVLFGEVRAAEVEKPANGKRPSEEGKTREDSFPFAIQLRFDDQGKINQMVISSFDLTTEPSPERK